jgi:hypothetical protein
MKTILILLLTCVASFAATTYTVLSSTTNRTIAPTTFGLQLLTNANAPELLTLIGAAPSSNAVTLSGTNVFTGTNTFTASKFFPANGMSRRLLLYTNINFRVDAFTNASAPTTPGGYANCGKIAQIQIPALIGTRSLVYMSYQIDKTNATASSYQPIFYGGANTNWLGYGISVSAGSTPQTLFSGNQLALFANAGSFTNQYQNAGSVAVNTQLPNPTNCVDTSASWPLYFGVTSTSGATNVLWMSLFLEELVIP